VTDRWLTAFVCIGRLLEFVRTPFGLKNAGQTFVRAMHAIFKIIIHSDHNPLTFLTESAPKSSKLIRWSLALAEYDIEFKYHAGKLNIAADSLSRPGPEVATCTDQLVGVVV